MSGRQVWQRTVPGTDVATTRLHVDVDDHGRARIHEAVLAQLLADAGWERAPAPGPVCAGCGEPVDPPRVCDEFVPAIHCCPEC